MNFQSKILLYSLNFSAKISYQKHFLTITSSVDNLNFHVKITRKI